MTIKIQELESLQDLTEVELEKVVGGQTLPAQQQGNSQNLRRALGELSPGATRVFFGILRGRNTFLRLFR